MADYEDGSVLLSTISGKTFRFAKGNTKGNLLLDLPNGIVIAVTTSIKLVEFFIPDENDIYHRAGDISFKKDEDQYSVDVFAESIEKIKLGNENKSLIRNTFADVTTISMKLSLEQKKKWYENRGINID